MSKVIIFGSTGLLGASLVPKLQSLGYTVLTQGRSGPTDLILDPSNRMEVRDALRQYCPDAVVNLVAATNVDQCEAYPQLAWAANAGVVASLVDGIAAISEKTGLNPHLVHISTDQVYDGAGPHPENYINPINVYGLSKYTGELLAERISSTILRTNFYGRSRCNGRESFSDWLVKSLRNQAPITVFDDVKFSAIHIDTLCEIITQCVLHRPVGVFNAGCRDSISKARFAVALADALSLPTDKLIIGSSADLSLKARRPVDMSLQVSRLENALDFQLPNICAEIAHTAQEYLNE